MSHAKSQKTTRIPEFPLNLNYLTQDQFSNSSNESDDDESMEKDEVELKLEKIVFGDESGFHQGLKSHKDKISSQAFENIEKIEVDDNKNEEQKNGIHDVDDADLFFLDSTPAVVPTSDLVRPHAHGFDDDINAHSEIKAAWVDSDDERIVVSLASNPRLRKLRMGESEDLINGNEYTKRLRRQFERLYPVPGWAAPATLPFKKRRRMSNASNSSSSDGSEGDLLINSDDPIVQPLIELLRNTNDLTKNSPSSLAPRKLRPEVVDIQRTKDVGQPQPSSIDSLAFHPRHPLLLSSGPASTLFLHHISPHSPSPNLLMTSLHLRSTPLKTSAFLPPHGSKIFFSGRRRYFHIWDLSTGAVSKISRIYGHKDEQRSMESFKLSPCGRWMGLVGSGRKGGGVINVLDAATCQWVAEVRVEGKGGVAGFDWWGNGEGIVVLGTGGEAVEWDIREKRVIGRWMDDGAVGTTIVALGGKGAGDDRIGGDRWVAVGSSSGIVNVYERRTWGAQLPERPRPARTFDQLTTPTSDLTFSPDGQILAAASRWKRDALRLIHLPSCTVYRNWPTSVTPLGRISAVAFSSASDMLAVGNEQGKIRLWEIRG